MKLLVLILALVAVISSAQWYTLEKKLREHHTQSDVMESHAKALERRIVELETQLGEAEKRSIDKIAEDLNDTFVEGWGTMLEQFKRTLEETADEIEKQFEHEVPDDSARDEPGDEIDERT